MSGSRRAAASALIVVTGAVVLGAASASEIEPQDVRYGFGTTPEAQELASYYAIGPDGRGLPPGRGTYAEGQRLYGQRCAGCHGARLEGWAKGMMMPPEMAAMGDGRLIGGRGSLTTAAPVFTVESFWPYATTLWDYTKRAMPQNAPGSLSDQEVYSLVAFMLAEAKVIPKTAVMDATNLPRVKMPNRDGFVPDGRPEPAILDLSLPTPSSPPAGAMGPAMTSSTMRQPTPD